jgi:hypothetical protein
MAHPRVLPNPYSALDHEGIPCGAFPFDPVHGGGARRWVGATIASALLDEEAAKKARQGAVVVGRRAESFVATPQRTLYAFDLTPQAVLATPHYRMGARMGEIFPVDVESARALGVDFVPPLEKLAGARAHAIAEWTAQHGTPPDTSRWPANLQSESPPPTAPEADAPAQDNPTPSAAADVAKDGDS